MSTARATPAGQGVIIPGTMASPGFVVSGKGEPRSLQLFQPRGRAGPLRTKAREKFRFGSVRGTLKEMGITLLSAGADEAPGAYKDIHTVMAAQQDSRNSGPI